MQQGDLTRSVPKMLLIAALISLALILGILTGSSVTTVRHLAAEGLSTSSFGQIRLMLLSYHSDYGEFPSPRYRATPDGPTHSWRILLIPYIDGEAKKLYKQYDFDNEWNSSGNLQVARSLSSSLFGMAGDQGSEDYAQYLTIGEGDKWPTWPHVKSLKTLLVTKGGDRFLIVEYPDSHIYWTEPRY